MLRLRWTASLFYPLVTMGFSTGTNRKVKRFSLLPAFPGASGLAQMLRVCCAGVLVVAVWLLLSLVHLEVAPAKIVRVGVGVQKMR